MGDLIRREELLTSQFVHTECYLQENKDRHLDVYKKGWNDALQAAYDNAPAVDAVKVVRCKDCKHRVVNENYGDRGYLSIKAMCELDTGDPFEFGRDAEDDNWFCKDGERKTDG